MTPNLRVTMGIWLIVIGLGCGIVFSRSPVHAQNQLPKGAPKAIAALTNSAQTVVGTGAVVDTIQCYNPNAAATYLQMFNVASATSVTVGTTVPTLSIGIPGTGVDPQIQLSSVNAWFGLGIKVAAATTQGGGSAPSSAIDCNFVLR